MDTKDQINERISKFIADMETARTSDRLEYLAHMYERFPDPRMQSPSLFTRWRDEVFDGQFVDYMGMYRPRNVDASYYTSVSNEFSTVTRERLINDDYFTHSNEEYDYMIRKMMENIDRVLKETMLNLDTDVFDNFQW